MNKTRVVRVGSLGNFRFPRGTYLYTGSARNRLVGRLLRHFGRKKKNHWHIDYLLKRPEARIERVLLYNPRLGECRINQKIHRLPGAEVIAKGFGASDCASGCAAHLAYFAEKNFSEREEQLG